MPPILDYVVQCVQSVWPVLPQSLDVKEFEAKISGPSLEPNFIKFLWNVVAAMRGMLWRLCVGGKPILVFSIELNNINYREAARYVRLGMDHFEIRARKLDRLVPRRRFHHGSEPGITGKEPLGIEADDDVRWIFPPFDPTEKEKKKIL